MMLVNRSVYENIPFITVEYSEDYTSLVGEDIYFCKNANKYGYTVFVDSCDK